MDAATVDDAASEIAAAIGEPARARMLYCLLDGHARTSTELASVAQISASAASIHLHRLKAAHLVTVLAQGKHRYYSLRGPEVAGVLEGLSVLAGSPRPFVPNTPSRLRAARTCYDHIAGTLGVALHDRCRMMKWICHREDAYDLTPAGIRGLQVIGIDVEQARGMRRRFAYGCTDWSERRPHLGGALGAVLLQLLLRKRWVAQDLDSRALSITRIGRGELQAHFGLQL